MKRETSVSRPWRVIIVGGGFAGLRAAQALKSDVFDAILSVVESCRRLNVSVRDYFSAILPGLADLPIRCLPDLTPAVWVARHS